MTEDEQSEIWEIESEVDGAVRLLLRAQERVCKLAKEDRPTSDAYDLRAELARVTAERDELRARLAQITAARPTSPDGALPDELDAYVEHRVGTRFGWWEAADWTFARVFLGDDATSPGVHSWAAFDQNSSDDIDADAKLCLRRFLVEGVRP